MWATTRQASLRKKYAASLTPLCSLMRLKRLTPML
ncbi:hypothetical protein EVA_17530 [gut metagenome]|uniref:Uncharacterized protein n=1 Tax=gut metagenome TaxID=749906 RepID=J9FIV0_9ZZZZ